MEDELLVAAFLQLKVTASVQGALGLLIFVFDHICTSCIISIHFFGLFFFDYYLGESIYSRLNFCCALAKIYLHKIIVERIKKTHMHLLFTKVV